MPSRRAKEKYPALRRDLNLKVRRYYIEPDYIHGARDKNGKVVIRPLTNDEKAWLNKFYEETVITKFNKDGTDLYDSVEERRKIWRDNNERNRCLFNNTQKRAMLKPFSTEKYDQESIKNVGHLDSELLLINEMEKEEPGYIRLEFLKNVENYSKGDKILRLPVEGKCPGKVPGTIAVVTNGKIEIFKVSADVKVIE